MIQESQTVSTEVALRIVADPRRRAILSQLRDSEETTITLDTLVNRITPENPPPKTTETHATPPVIDIHHKHLPKLDEANMITYDLRTKTIRYNPDERVERLLQFVAEDLE